MPAGFTDGGRVVQVTKAEMAAVLAALGVAGAAKLDVRGLMKKANVSGGVATYREKGHRFRDKVDAAVYQRLADYQSDGGLIRVVDEAAPPVVVPTKVKVKGKPKKVVGKPGRPKGGSAVDRKGVVYQTNGRPVLGSPLWAFREYFAQKPLAVSERGPGVMRAVIDELKRVGRAGPGKSPVPVTKDELLEVLVKQFPDRDRNGLRTNMNNLVPSRLRDEYRIFVWSAPVAGLKGRLGYYIVGDGDKPQPEVVPESADRGR